MIAAPDKLDKQARRIDGLNRRVLHVVHTMRWQGLALHLEYTPKERWRLSTGLTLRPKWPASSSRTPRSSALVTPCSPIRLIKRIDSVAKSNTQTQENSYD
jgi:hypothetical protein